LFAFLLILPKAGKFRINVYQISAFSNPFGWHKKLGAKVVGPLFITKLSLFYYYILHFLMFHNICPYMLNLFIISMNEYYSHIVSASSRHLGPECRRCYMRKCES
jgi:hypothetical protein